MSVMIRCVRIFDHLAPSPVPGSATWRISAIMRSSFIKVALNDTSFNRFKISLAVRGVPGRSRGLICTRIECSASLSRTSGVIVGLPAKPPSQCGSPSISTAWNTVGRQADARSTSDVMSGLRKILPRPVLTFVAVTNNFIGERDRRLKSMLSS